MSSDEVADLITPKRAVVASAEIEGGFLSVTHSQLAQLGSMTNLLQSGVASAQRVFELLDTDQQSPDAVGGVSVDGTGATPFFTLLLSAIFCH
ncbi:hypothetical protein ACX80V_12385 [Arthrobacter sp. MDT3-24]